MKKTFTIAAGLCFVVLIFSNFVTSTTVNNFVFTNMNESPELPDVPYNYSDIEMPDHLINPNTSASSPDPGYGSGGVDPQAFEDVTDHGATLGRVLFFDEKLSALENISCASCHIQELSFADDKRLSEGVQTETKRNAMNLNDIAWTNADAFFWDMSHSDLNEMIRLPLTDENEIGADMLDVQLKLSLTDYYPELFENAFGSTDITEERIVEALVQFLESMVTFNTKFDQAAASNFAIFTEQEKLGQTVFANNCSTCHTQGFHAFPFGEDSIFVEQFQGPFFEFFPFIFNNGLPADPNDAGAGENMPGFENLFKIPSLRNIELTGPYMHDGSIETLEDVVRFYSEETENNEWNFGFIPEGGFNFSDQEQAALVAFLKTLTDHTFGENPKWSNPFGLNDIENIPEVEDLVMKPNPMSDRSIIEWNNPNNDQSYINIFDSTGKALITDQTNENTYTFEKQNLSAGMYLIELIVGDKKSTRRLVVQ